ncbi:MAG TPA: glucokinase [Rhizomicrobium sp.]|nr:glucokinase [Rhizomicrobium sp.]
MNENLTVLVGDVGGTHARFAIADVSAEPIRMSHRIDFGADRFASFEAVLRTYLDQIGLTQPEAAAIAVAGPVTKGRVDFTNRGWHASEGQLRALGFRRALLINDFAALAFSIAALETTTFRAIGPELPGLEGEPITILGAGTGFGVSCLARFRGRSVPLATEGGHIGFAPRGEQQVAVLQILSRRFGHVSVERVLSGPGLENTYQALEEMDGRKPQALSAPDIVAQSEAGDRSCRAAVDMFCSVYGAVAGDFALAHGARGGVFIAGGIAEKIELYLKQGQFRAAFEDKGRLSYFVQPIPTSLMLDPDATFLGAARASLEFSDT